MQRNDHFQSLQPRRVPVCTSRDERTRRVVVVRNKRRSVRCALRSAIVYPKTSINSLVTGGWEAGDGRHVLCNMGRLRVASCSRAMYSGRSRRERKKELQTLWCACEREWDADFRGVVRELTRARQLILLFLVPSLTPSLPTCHRPRVPPTTAASLKTTTIRHRAKLH